MNRWKIAFFVSLTLLVLVTAFSIYAIIDQSVTITYMNESYDDTDNDLNNLSKIINQTNFTKREIKNLLKQHKLFEYMNFAKDTISLDRVNLIFKDDKLFKITNQW